MKARTGTIKTSSFGEELDIVLSDAIERNDGYSYLYEIEWYAFPQMWASTALGHGGMGGAAMTTAQTYAVFVDHGHADVYFGGRWCYKMDRQRAMECIYDRRFPGKGAIDGYRT